MDVTRMQIIESAESPRELLHSDRGDSYPWKRREVFASEDCRRQRIKLTVPYPLSEAHSRSVGVLNAPCTTMTPIKGRTYVQYQISLGWLHLVWVPDDGMASGPHADLVY